MSKNVDHIQHVKSNVVLDNEGVLSPKLPNPSALVEGEIAVNYAKGYETLSIKNASGDVVPFSSDEVILTKADEVFVGDTEPTNDNIEVWVDTSISPLAADVYSKEEVNTLVDGVSAVTSAHTADTSIHMSSTEKENLDSLATNISAISGITSTKVNNWDGAATNSHTHTNKTALDSITGNVGTMAYENTTSYSSATEVNTALTDKADTATTIAGYGITDAKIENQIITLGSNNITVSSATEVNTALAGKSDTGHTHSSNEVTSMSGYSMAASGTSITTSDTLNQAIGKLEKRFDGVSIVKISQTDYDNLNPKDSNTLYIITED